MVVCICNSHSLLQVPSSISYSLTRSCSATGYGPRPACPAYSKGEEKQDKKERGRVQRVSSVSKFLYLPMDKYLFCSELRKGSKCDEGLLEKK